MSDEHRAVPLPGTSEDVHEFRMRTYMVLGFATVPFLGPFSIYSFLQLRIALGILTGLVTALAVINAISILRVRSPLIPYWLLYFVILSGLVIGIAALGSRVAFWCYPVAFVTLFVNDHRQARFMILCGILLLVPTAFLFMEIEFAARFVITYVMACYFGELVVNLLDKLQARQLELAITDPLTNAFNRRHLASCFESAIEQHLRDLGSVSLITLDIDHFKAINDQYGHEAGDRALVNLVRLLQQRVRKVDTVFRTGGEEFAILARGISLEQAYVLAEDIRSEIENTDLLPEKRITASLGLVQYEDNEGMDSCLRRADTNLYEAKQRGRNRVWPQFRDQ